MDGGNSIFLTLERRRVFLKIENGDLGEEGFEPRNGLGLLVEEDLGVLFAVLHRSLGLIRLSFAKDF